MTLRTNVWLPLLASTLLCGCGEQAVEESDEPFAPDVPASMVGKADGSGRDWPAQAALPATCDLEPAFRTFFAPDDPNVTLELKLIDKIREARKAAGGPAFPEGQNPYRIRWAVYNLTHADIIQRLIEAERENVDVQVLIEADQLFQWYCDTDEKFQRGGLEVHKDYKKITPEQKVSGDLIGISEYGLMHLKTRLFEMPGWSALLTGSYNPNQGAGANEESNHLIRDQRLIARYAAAYEAVLYKKQMPNQWDEGQAINVLFSPAGTGLRPATKMLEWLDQEQEQILLMVFTIREVGSPGYPKTLLQILKEKAAAGVPVYLITDRKQSDGITLSGEKPSADDKTEDTIRSYGIHVFEAVNTADALFGSPNPYAAMHHKTAILGRNRIRIITDAANWTYSALGGKTSDAKNVESQLFIDTQALDGGYTGRRYMAQWMLVLSRYVQQSVDQDREIGFDEVAGKLQALPGWPSQRIHFVNEKAETQFGENIFAVGGPDALGKWGMAGPGLPLYTDAASYPRWSTKEPVQMVLGSRFEWKFTARNGEAVRWENGNNRVSIVAPAICLDGRDGVAAADAGTAKGSWR